MSEDKGNKKPQQNQQNNQAPNNVVAMPERCPVCNGKAQRSVFCNEHFTWFKEGLVNRKGEKPKDFDKKYQAFLRKHKQAA